MKTAFPLEVVIFPTLRTLNLKVEKNTLNSSHKHNAQIYRNGYVHKKGRLILCIYQKIVKAAIAKDRSKDEVADADGHDSGGPPPTFLTGRVDLDAGWLESPMVQARTLLLVEVVTCAWTGLEEDEGPSIYRQVAPPDANAAHLSETAPFSLRNSFVEDMGSCFSWK